LRGLITMHADLKQKIFARNKGKLKFAGWQHPVIRLVRKIMNNDHDGSERLVAAEGLWAHIKLIETGMDIRCVVICPDLLYSDEALEVAGKCMDKAADIYVVSPKIFGRISDRDGPDGLFSLIRLPVWQTDGLQLGKMHSLPCWMVSKIPGISGLSSVPVTGQAQMRCLYATGGRGSPARNL